MIKGESEGSNQGFVQHKGGGAPEPTLDSLLSGGDVRALPFQPVSPREDYLARELLKELAGIMPPELWKQRRDLECGRLGGVRFEVRLRLETDDGLHLVVDPEVFRAHPRAAGGDALSRGGSDRRAIALGTAEMVNNGDLFESDRCETVKHPALFKLRPQEGQNDLLGVEVQACFGSPEVIPDLLENMLRRFEAELVVIGRYTDEAFRVACDGERLVTLKIFGTEEDENSPLLRRRSENRAENAFAAAAERYRDSSDEQTRAPYSLARAVLQPHLENFIDCELQAAQRGGSVSAETLDAIPPQVKSIALTAPDTAAVTVEIPWEQRRVPWQGEGEGRRYEITLRRSTAFFKFSLCDGSLACREV